MKEKKSNLLDVKSLFFRLSSVWLESDSFVLSVWRSVRSSDGFGGVSRLGKCLPEVRRDALVPIGLLHIKCHHKAGCRCQWCGGRFCRRCGCGQVRLQAGGDVGV